MLCSYLHDLSPTIIQLGFFKIQWYSLSYLLGFICTGYLFKYLNKKQISPLHHSKAFDFVFIIGVFGVMLGGRLGYILFYYIPDIGWQQFLDHPWIIFKVWQGGMASHGGIIGVILASWWYARKHSVSWTEIGAGLCIGGCIGILFGRIANFINGELYGRIATASYGWLVKFPTALFDKGTPENKHLGVVINIAKQNDKNFATFLQENNSELTVAAIREPLLKAINKSAAIQQQIAPYLAERHPSQLYEGILEGLLLGVALLLFRCYKKNLPARYTVGLFFCCYALLRIAVESFRQPDSLHILYLTKGQFYSLFMIIIGLLFFFFPRKKPHLT